MTKQEINEIWERGMLKSADKIGRKYQAWLLDRQGVDADYSPFDLGEGQLRDNQK